MSLISDALKEAQKKRDELSFDSSIHKSPQKQSGAKKFLIVSVISFIVIIIIFVYLFFITEKRLQRIKKIKKPIIIAKKTFHKKQEIFELPAKEKKQKKNTIKINNKYQSKTLAKPKQKTNKQPQTQKNEPIVQKKEQKEIRQNGNLNDVRIKPVQVKKEKIKTKNYYLKKAENSLKQRLFDEAIKNYTVALSYSPDDTDILFNLGTVYLLKKQFLLALNEFEKILKKDPKNKKTLFNTGIALLKIGKIEKAKIIWENLYSIDPNYPEINYFLGIAEDLTQNYASAKRYYFSYLSKGKNPKFKEWIRKRLKKLN